MNRLKLLIKLVYDPRQATLKLYERRYFVTALVLSLIITLVYFGPSAGLLTDFREFAREFGHSEGFGRFVLFSILPALVGKSLLPLFFLSAFVTPALIVLSGLFKHQGGYGRLLRQQYTGLLTVVLYEWGLAHLLVMAPAFLWFSPRSTNY